MDRININNKDDLEVRINLLTVQMENPSFKLEDLNINFDFQINWIDNLLRDKVINYHNQNSSNQITSYNEKISINFKNCSLKKVSCINIVEDEILELHIDNGSIQELKLLDNKISGKFYINKQYGNNKKSIKIKKLIIKDTVFKENFKLHHAKIKTLTIEDTDFEKHADFFRSKFEQGTLEKDKKANVAKNDIGFKAINFKGLALFGNTTFRKKLVFKYVTFESFSHFRKSKLNKGLDLDYCNIQNEMNFFDVEKLNTKEAKKCTSQETYRIIKHNFEKIGNKIEANKYHALELEQKEISLENENTRNWLDFIVFKIHHLSSEYSTNWFLSLLWILVIGFISTGLTSLSQIVFPYILLLLLGILIFEKIQYGLIFSILCFLLIILTSQELNLNNLLQNISLINIENSDFVFIGKEINKLSTWEGIILFFNKISLGYLYYQLVTSIRKDTRK